MAGRRLANKTLAEVKAANGKTPVPSHASTPRAPDGGPDWGVPVFDLVPKKDWMITFLVQLAYQGIIGAACAKANVSRRMAMYWRDHDADFAAAWDDAIDISSDRLECRLYEHAMGNGKGAVLANFFLCKGRRPELWRDNYDANKLAEALNNQIAGRIGLVDPVQVETSPRGEVCLDPPAIGSSDAA